MRELNPAELGTSERYKLLIGAVTPRPIALVSTIDAQGRTNLAPYSFFNAVGATPMSLMFCPAGTPSGDKDTLSNCRPVSAGGQGEFVVNLAVESYARAMAAAAEALPPGESEFSACGFQEAPSSIVKPPRVADSPIAFECRTTHLIRLAPEQPTGANLVIGEVVNIWVRDGVVDERMRVNPTLLATIGRMGGLDYCTTRDRFSMKANLSGLDDPPPFPADVGPNKSPR